MDNSTIYSIVFSDEENELNPDYSFFFFNGSIIMNNTLFIKSQILNDSIIGVFSIDDVIDFSSYNFNCLALEVKTTDENKTEGWFDIVPDECPPFVFVNMGAGKRELPLGHGLSIIAENKHQYEIIKCSIEVYYNSTIKLLNSNKKIDFTLNPKSKWVYPYSFYLKKPLFSEVTVILTIENTYCKMSGKSIGQWYFFNSFEGYTPMRNYSRIKDKIDEYIEKLEIK